MSADAWTARAYRLAEVIQWNCAKEMARVERGGPRMSFRERTMRHYDQHAAVELGNLIIARLGPGQSQKGEG